jgi:uncharacterized protein (DUF58 family)
MWLWTLITWPWRRVRWMATARPMRFTRFGTFYILFSLAVGAAAINTGNNLLYLMLGLLLGFIIISGFLSDSCLWGLDVTFEPVGDFYAGQAAEWDMTARKSWFPAVIAQVETFWRDGETTRNLFFWVPRYGTAQQKISLTPPQRGLLQLDHLRYATRFPFGLFEKSRQRKMDLSWVVFPRIRLLPLSLLRAAGAVFSDQPAQRKGPGATPFDLREYQVGDSSKRIHWKSSAKLGQMMIVEMEEESGMSQNVLVTRWPESEDFISFVASLVYTLIRQGQRVGLRTPGMKFPADRSNSQLKKILTYLALLDSSRETASIPAGNKRWIDALDLWKRQAAVR